jgi:hypothetical protein
MIKLKINLFGVLFAVLGLGVTACSPVKQVLKNPKHFKIVADSVVKRGYCVNDSIVIHDTLTKEKIVVKDTLIHDSSFSHSLASVDAFDTTLGSGAKVTIKKGFITVSCPATEIQKEKWYKQKVVVRDKKLESILKEELASAEKQLKDCKEELKAKNKELKAMKWKKGGGNTKFYLLLGLVVLYIAFRLKKSIGL